MGRASKRMKRQNNRRQADQQKQEAVQTEQELSKLFAERKYEQVLEKLAVLIAAKDVKPEYLYDGAYSYFMLGDLERASQWVSNTLTYAPAHVDARILLARICMAQKRQSDAFAILDFLAEHDADDLTEEQREDIRDIGGYALETAGQAEGQDYPHLVALLHAGQPAQKKEAPSNTLEMLRNLKKKVHDFDRKEEAPAAEPAKVAEPVKVAEPATPVAGLAQQQVDDVLAKPISLAEKIRILNAFAGASYAADDFAAAETLLRAALQLDESDAATIRNLALTIAAEGEKEKALQIASQLPVTDFVLLQAIKDLRP